MSNVCVCVCVCVGTVVVQWLRYCATNQKVTVSIPDGVMEFFIDVNPSDHTMALGSTQPLTEISTRCISWGKCGRCLRLTTLWSSCAVVKKSGSLNLLETSGPLQACNGTALSLPLPLWVCMWVLYYNCKIITLPSVLNSVLLCNCVCH
jgi:hypothetical protein